MIRKLLLSTLGAFTIGLASLGLGSAEASGPSLTKRVLWSSQHA